MRVTRLRVSVIAASVLATFSGHAFAARVDYTVDLGMERNSNVTMVPADPIEQRYLRAGVGFSITENISALQLNLDGRAEYRDYEDDIFADTVDGTLSGRMNWVAIPQRLFFVVEDNLTVQPVDSLVPDGPGNRQQVNVFSAGPTVLFNWTSSLHGQAELRYVHSDAEVTDEFNSQRLAAAVRTIKELSPTSRVSLNLQAQRVDFDDDIVARDYNRYDIYGRYVRTLANFELGADLGYSRIDYRQGESRSEPLLRADAQWNLSPHSQLIAAVSSQFSDTATDALTGIQSEATVPENVLTGDAVVNASPYEVRSIDLGYQYTGTRLTFSLTPYVQKRDYVDSDTFDQKTRGARFDLQWLIRRSLTLGSYATWERLDYTQLNREDETSRVGASLEYQWAPRWSARLHAERYKRDSTDVGQSVSQNLIYLSIAYSNR
ncbi:MAG TPA: outer membrane beta-barrel protein [Pseudoxanthomonas sp.]|nr:outer membrane beta-barrel protein [Pseudoxanthomonas sp.]